MKHEIEFPRGHRELPEAEPEWTRCANCKDGCVYCTCRVCRHGRDVYCPRHPPIVDPADVQRMTISNYLARDFEDVTPIVLTPNANKYGFLSEGPSASDRRPLKGDLFVTGFWSDVQPHLGFYLVKTGLPKYRVMTDMDLVDLRFKRDAEDEAKFLTVVRDLPILIVRVGFVATKIADLSGVIFETLRLREIAGKRTIVVNDGITPWSKTHKAYSPELDAYLTSYTSRINISPKRI